MERFVGNGSAPVGSNKTLMNAYPSVASPLTRKRVYDAYAGAGQAVADATAELYLGRTTALGTPGATFTPNNLDPGGPAGECVVGQGTYSGEPTYTSNKDLIWLPCHQRNTIRWVVSEASEIVIPATQNAGIGMRSSSATGSAVYRGTMCWKE